MSRRSSALLVALACSLLSGCASLFAEPVERRVHGRVIDGRFIDDEAYAQFLSAALAEASGDLEGAERAYRRAAESDKESAEIWARIGAVRCVQYGIEGSREAFERAQRIDPTFASLPFERAWCLANHGDIQAASTFASQAVSLDPTRLDACLLYARLAELRGETETAARWLEGLWARDPSQRPLLEAIDLFALHHDRPSLRARAQERLLSLDARSSPTASLAQLDALLLTDALDDARALASRLRITPAALALRAAALGKGSLAQEQAEHVLAADASSADARIASLVAADLRQDKQAFRAALSATPARSSQPSPLGRLLLAELLARHGAHPSLAIDEFSSPPASEDDPLLARVRARMASAKPPRD